MFATIQQILLLLSLCPFAGMGIYAIYELVRRAGVRILVSAGRDASLVWRAKRPPRRTSPIEAAFLVFGPEWALGAPDEETGEAGGVAPGAARLVTAGLLDLARRGEIFLRQNPDGSFDIRPGPVSRATGVRAALRDAILAGPVARLEPVPDPGVARRVREFLDHSLQKMRRSLRLKGYEGHWLLRLVTGAISLWKRPHLLFGSVLLAFIVVAVPLYVAIGAVVSALQIDPWWMTDERFFAAVWILALAMVPRCYRYLRGRAGELTLDFERTMGWDLHPGNWLGVLGIHAYWRVMRFEKSLAAAQARESDLRLGPRLWEKRLAWAVALDRVDEWAGAVGEFHSPVTWCQAADGSAAPVSSLAGIARELERTLELTLDSEPGPSNPEAADPTTYDSIEPPARLPAATRAPYGCIGIFFGLVFLSMAGGLGVFTSVAWRNERDRAFVVFAWVFLGLWSVLMVHLFRKALASRRRS